MNGFTLLQISENVVRKSAEMAERDPHGVIITLVSVAVVFSSLIILYYAYSFIGKITSTGLDLKSCRCIGRKKTQVKSDKGIPSDETTAAIAMALDQELNGEAYAAISMALHLYSEDTVHDKESYIITIRRK